MLHDFMYVLRLSRYVKIWELGFLPSEKRVTNEKGGRQAWAPWAWIGIGWSTHLWLLICAQVDRNRNRCVSIMHAFLISAHWETPEGMTPQKQWEQPVPSSQILNTILHEKEQVFGKNWQIPGLGQGKDEMSLEHFHLSESKTVPKEWTCHKDTGISLKGLPIAKSGVIWTRKLITMVMDYKGHRRK